MTKRLAKALAAASVIAFVTTSGSALAAPKADADGSSDKSLGTAEYTGERTLSSDKAIDATVEIDSVEREKNGGLTTLTFTVRNDDPKVELRLSNTLRHTAYDYDQIGAMSGVSIDSADKVRYYNLSDENLYCLCSTSDGGTAPSTLRAGDTGTVWVSFLTPKDMTEATVNIPGFAPIKNVKIG